MKNLNNIIFIFLCFAAVTANSQSYTSYFTGNTEDFAPQDQNFSLTVMGGGPEVDVAMKLFLEDARGGDVLVLRTSGSDGYNDYLFSELGVTINSVETIVCHSREASSDPYVLERILKADAIWFAGGDQWEYLSYWRDTPLQQYINFGILDKGIPVGGTSAGAVIMGHYQFTAENGTITSEEALSNPYHERMTIDNRPFLIMPLPVPLIFDSHFADRDRQGRMASFIARIKQDYGDFAFGIGLDEESSARIVGSDVVFYDDTFEDHNNYAHLYSYNCTEESDNFIVQENQQLVWTNQLKYGTSPMTPKDLISFNFLTSFENNTFHKKYDANIDDGSFSLTEFEQDDTPFPLPCSVLTDVIEDTERSLAIAPNPADNKLKINLDDSVLKSLQIISSSGQIMKYKSVNEEGETSIDLSNFSSGIYFLKAEIDGESVVRKFVKQ